MISKKGPFSRNHMSLTLLWSKINYRFCQSSPLSFIDAYIRTTPEKIVDYVIVLMITIRLDDNRVSFYTNASLLNNFNILQHYDLYRL